MPLTEEQFNKLDAEGFTPEEIAAFEQQRNSEQQAPQQQEPQAQPQQQGILQKIMELGTSGVPNAIGSLIGGIIQPPAKIIGRAGQAVESVMSGKPPMGYNIPLPQSMGGNIPIEPAKSMSQALGPVAQTTAMMLGSPMAAGSLYGAGMGMEEQEGIGGIAGKAALGGLIGGAAGVATGRYKLPSIDKEKLAGKVVNSLIKPAHKDFLFGKNPGLGVAKEGITANSMEELGTKVSERITLLNDAAKSIRNTPENMYKTIDVSDIRKPLVDMVTKLKKLPLTNAQEISGIESATSDITGFVKAIDKVGLNKLNINQGYQLKEAISGMQKWNRESSLGTELNKSLKQVYHSIDSKIDIAIPELRSLNSRMSNLISAKQAISHRVEVLSKQEPMPTMMKLIDLPFAAFKTTTGKTMLGKLLAEKYKIPK